MKNILTAIFLALGIVFASAQKLPPRPPHPPHPAHLKHPPHPPHPLHSKKYKKYEKKRMVAHKRPILITPDGQKFRAGDLPPRPKRLPLPPRPPRSN